MFARLFQHVRTLRFRLAVLCVVVFGIIQVGLCLVILNARERYLRRDFDQRLIDRAETVVEAVRHRAREAEATRDSQGGQPHLSPLHLPGYFFQIRNAAGAIRERSGNLRGATLPLSDRAKASQSTAQPVLENVEGQDVGLHADAPPRFRLLTTYCDGSGIDPFYLQIGADVAPLEASVARLRRLFLIVVPAGLLLAAAASSVLVRRSLAPIGEIAKQARDYTAAHLDRRIQTRPGADEVADLIAVINGMLDRLEGAFAAQERFIADASHELKTPLSVILAETQLLLQQVRTAEEYDQFVSHVQDQLRQLVRLVDSLLTLARADAGFPLADTQPVSINEVVTDAVARCEPLAHHQEVRLVPTLVPPTQEGLEAFVQGDPELLRAVIENLIRNAIRFSPADQAVDVVVTMDGAEVQVSVRDKGPGIRPEDLDRVFERFFSIPREKEPVQGAGLGLAIARGVASLHHGSITAANRDGGGCEFVLHLPQTGPDGH